jgi:PEP-CTERM motif
LRLTRRSQRPYPWPPEQAQPAVSKPCRTTNGASSVVVPVPPVANGDQFADDSNRYFVISGFDFNKAVFSSTTNSFEFDNVAVGGVPEPSTWVMLTLGFAGLGYAGYRRAKGASTAHSAA